MFSKVDLAYNNVSFLSWFLKINLHKFVKKNYIFVFKKFKFLKKSDLAYYNVSFSYDKFQYFEENIKKNNCWLGLL